MTSDEAGTVAIDRTAVECEIHIAAPPETVFSFFTDPEKRVRWMGIAAELDPRPGGLYRVDINGRDVARGEYVVVEPPSRVVIAFGWEGEDENPVPPGSTTLEVTLTPEAGARCYGSRTAACPSLRPPATWRAGSTNWSG